MDTNKLKALAALGSLPPDAREFLKDIMQGSNNIVNLGDNTHIHIGTKIQYGSAPNKHQSGSSSSSDATKLPEVSSGRSYAPPSSANEQPASKIGGSVAKRPAAPVETVNEESTQENAPSTEVPFVTNSSADANVSAILGTDED